MLKLKVRKKDIVDSYKNIICVGYCDLCTVLRNKDARFYTSGVYGWNADIYEIDYNTCIVTGYRPFGNIFASYSGICNKYEQKAREITQDRTSTYEQQCEKLDILLNEFIQECKQINK